MNKITSIVSFCTHDARFFRRCIEALTPFSDQIIVPICDHFYNGQEENYALLQQIYQSYPDLHFVEFAYSRDQLYGTPSAIRPGSPGYAQHWHNSARLVANYFLDDETTHVLFVDVDEIFSGDVCDVPYEKYDALRFATHWYFGSADNIATCTPDGPLLVRRDHLTTERLLDEDERMGMYVTIEGHKKREYLPGGQPIVHHYSWVRSEEEMRRKVKSWGHHWERDWESLIENGKGEDFVRGYSYKKGPVFWDPLSEEIAIPSQRVNLDDHRTFTLPNLSRVTPKQIFRRELRRLVERDAPLDELFLEVF